MVDHLRTFMLVLGVAFRVDPWRTVGAIVLEGLGQTNWVLLGLWLKLVTDGLVERNTHSIIVGVAGLALAPSVLGALANGFGARMRLTMYEKAGFAFEKKYAEVTASLSGLMHHEHPEYRDKLELLQQNKRLLGSAANGVLFTLVVAIQMFTTLALVGSVHPLLLALPLFGIPSVIARGFAERANRRAEERMAPILRRSRHLYELGTQSGPSKEVRVFRLQRELRFRHDAAWMEAHAISARIRWRFSAINALSSAVFAVGFIGAVVFVALEAVDGKLSAGDVVMTVTIAGRVNALVGQAVGQLSWLMQSLRSADRFRWLLDYEKVEQSDGATNTAPLSLRYGIEFKGVTFRYPGADRDVLQDVSLNLPAGAVVALVGENGAGKTTFVKLLCGFYQPQRGPITIDGVDLSSLEAADWRARITAGFQDFAKLEFLLRESVGVGDLARIEDEAAVVSALTRSGGSDIVSVVPNGLATQLGRTWESGIDLSIGQWQKLALGRALMRVDTVLSIFDEPTSALDAETEHALFERYAAESRARRINGGITLLVSHRFSTVRSADLIVVLDKGRVVETGSHPELMARGGLYAELYSIQAKGYR